MEHIVWYHHTAKEKGRKTRKKKKGRQIGRKIEIQRKAEYGRVHVVSMAAAALSYDHHQRRGGETIL